MPVTYWALFPSTNLHFDILIPQLRPHRAYSLVERIARVVMVTTEGPWTQSCT